MNIVRIFDKYLFAFCYDNESADEFSRLFSDWQDPYVLFKFFKENEKDLFSAFWKINSIDEAVMKTREYADQFEQQLVMRAEQPAARQNEGLETLFAPLDDRQLRNPKLNPSKAKRGWLRLYGLRAEKDAYIVIGGAIKLIFTMEESQCTQEELNKLEKCRKFLLERNLADIDGIIEEFEI